MSKTKQNRLAVWTMVTAMIATVVFRGPLVLTAGERDAFMEYFTIELPAGWVGGSQLQIARSLLAYGELQPDSTMTAALKQLMEMTRPGVRARGGLTFAAISISESRRRTEVTASIARGATRVRPEQLRGDDSYGQRLVESYKQARRGCNARLLAVSGALVTGGYPAHRVTIEVSEEGQDTVLYVTHLVMQPLQNHVIILMTPVEEAASRLADFEEMLHTLKFN